MTQHDVSQWPLVVSVIDGCKKAEDLRDVAARWQDWLSWNEPFAALQIFPAGDNALLSDRDRWLSWWLEGQRRAIRRNVIGLASVIPGVHYDKMPQMSIHKVFGVPSATFGSVNTALRWLEARAFRPNEIVFNRAAVEVALAGVA
ncbi:hypothetical protein [Steroidobacter sp.]|uniref:hypothetical protein n=1 Tax=Steroidobacter sp. TaxID=1978227 RepID=UPI001A4F4706|nr:hypothetical protein [Steroidobacter sp.]MBL8272057.1 hypothetical protein [Steroidobacter sp.]